ncbi:midasin [Saitoella complicata NRRL Y-17804]|uniref:Midasin n=1 Tax=Saitoella complicata (strain BCRC 22490 / CBS 7301 / JCM 7358 / NBRC 10748 / NRRL Y-17804) TaxID=698492 RepID=A0A0E9NGD7_SAICN|nr:midasin [Saitoella complicata NRRL Y-17804]ODQ53592.1 midasin [Saitoella complicata NRRL Y-17804]GAO48771.1 hypothetical protein G7K_2940-t1 [Saitoella complicata NRRL Y-17804]
MSDTAMADVEVEAPTTVVEEQEPPMPLFNPLAMNLAVALSSIAPIIPAEAHAILANPATPTAQYLDTLSLLALDPRFTLHILAAYRPIFPDLVARWHQAVETRVEDLACAFGRVLAIAPHVAEYAVEYLHCGSSFLRSLTGVTSKSTDEEVTECDAERTKELLLAAYRLVRFKKDAFLGLVDVSTMFALFRHPSLPVRALAIELWCITLSAADAARLEMIRAHLGEGAVTGSWEGTEDMDYGFISYMEDRREKMEQVKYMNQDYLTENTDAQPRVLKEEDLSPFTVNLSGILLPRFRDVGPQSTPVVLTPTTKRNVAAIAKALLGRAPILLTGLSGSGKTFLIESIAHALGRAEDLVRIHLGDQTDAKLLLGTYVTSNTPGEFTWQPGVLTKAVREGKWILVEDVDKAPAEVLSVLLPLMERGEIGIPSRGETVKAGRGFRMIATKTLPESYGRRKKHLEAETESGIGGHLWERVVIELAPEDELLEIVAKRFPVLATIAERIVDVYKAVRETYRDPAFFMMSKTSLGRAVTTRDLVKWCTRITALYASAGITNPDAPVSQGLQDYIFAEAVDCFGGMIHTIDGREYLVSRIGTELEVPPERVQLFLRAHVPRHAEDEETLQVGRAVMRKNVAAAQAISRRKRRPFATTGHALRLLEQLGVAVTLSEPVLLVGETGTGKTTIVQQLADTLGHNLVAINLSQQTESGDLLGGYKPIDAKILAVPLKESFDVIFERTFSMKKNARFMEVVNKVYGAQEWNKLVRLFHESVKLAEQRLATLNAPSEEPTKKKRKVDPELVGLWDQFAKDVANFEVQQSQISKSFAFSFVEGSLIKAVRNGDWLLLDEINLAAADTLESISGLLQEGGGSIMLSEKGDIEPIKPHPEFRIFANMNPATDVGKRDLPSGLRSRFTELYVHSPDTNMDDLLAIIRKYIAHLSIGDDRAAHDVAQLYMKAKELSESNRLVDGANQKPHFSIRTLARTLTYVGDIAPVYGLRRSLYEGFCMSCLTLLDKASEAVLRPIIEQYTLSGVKNVKSVISQIPRRPTEGDYVQFNHYWMHQGQYPVQEELHYIITPFVEKNMLNLVRATATRRFPVLIQGPTSSGKTSMVEYLAKKTGHRFVRINNHEHTDLQEYLGSYVSDNEGQLKFQEGLLVEAVRKGYWIVLDELNLAPSDVLEALNRLLDDNRELLIPETQEVVKPHPHFMLFATQNPPGLYGGRKVLSRAFRNRFLELHFDDIPESELEEILCKRCQIAPSYCARIVEVYKQLAIRRQSTRLLEQKNSFATLRDLFRWAGREAIGYQQLAENGYMLLAERVRKDEEKVIVKEVLEKVMKVKIDEAALYNVAALPEYELYASKSLSQGVVWTKAMRRLYTLVSHSLRWNEPVLLVGETGCGKTTVCQMLSDAFAKELHIINAHQNTETGDIIGAQRPVRNRAAMQTQLTKDLLRFFAQYAPELQFDADAAPTELVSAFQGLDLAGPIFSLPECTAAIARIEDGIRRVKVLFEWSDGTLITALKQGDLFLLDEISLADDSVLERLNSVLEPARTITLAEKGTDASIVTATQGFQFFATMNPGGDYGKKELSPALRNRFTEIWVPTMGDPEDVLQIVAGRLNDNVRSFAPKMVEFADWFGRTFAIGASASTISIRDILAWIGFMNNASKSIDDVLALFHGACMVFVDGLGSNASSGLGVDPQGLQREKLKCVNKLSDILGADLVAEYNRRYPVHVTVEVFGLGPFVIPRGEHGYMNMSFNLQAPTTAANAMRVLRALQVRKPVLLEGSPGVGKTSLVSAVAAAAQQPLTRINFSEQTDLMDLFGSDVPVEGGQSGEFAWRDAPFLRAMQQGHWVLLDEMNLASQSVLEGLNACLDHRGEAYIPELDRSFTCHPNFRVFAAQNPVSMGGARKGLPKSFVNRFTQVYVDTLTDEDMLLICQHLFPAADAETVSKLIRFVFRLQEETVIKRSFAQAGSPWEFNLRDTCRWLELLSTSTGLTQGCEPHEYLDVIVKQRLRTENDKHRVDDLYEEVFGFRPPTRSTHYQITDSFFQVGHSLLSREKKSQPCFLDTSTIMQSQLLPLELMMTCVQQAYPCIVIGPTRSGKTTLVRLLAGLTGATLDELAMNSDIDTMDILGGFEQMDIIRKSSGLFQAAYQWASMLLIDFATSQLTVSSQGDLVEHVFTLCATTLSGSVGDVQVLANLHILKEALHLLQQTFPDEAELMSLVTRTDAVLSGTQGPTVARFEWVDGLLMRAVEEGRWLILDNANLCSASVLDRLNGLLETNGTLIVNERSMPDGSPKVVKPHPNFRLFMTMDARNGELSRAMRNRGVEVFLGPVDKTSTPQDCLQQLRLAGIVPSLDERHDAIRRAQEHARAAQIGSPMCDIVTNSSITGGRGSATDSAANLIRTFDLVLRDSQASSLSPNVMNYLLRVIVDYVPLHLRSTLFRWLVLVIKFADSTEDFNTTIHELHHRFASLQQHPIVHTIMRLYVAITGRLSLQDSFAAAQTIYPMNNSYLVPSSSAVASDTGLAVASSLASSYDVLDRLVRMEEIMSRVSQRSLSLKPSAMTFLELSAATANGREVGDQGRSSEAVFPLLTANMTGLATWLSAIPDNGDSLVVAEKLVEFVEILEDIIALTNTTDFDTSYFHVYRSLLEEWLEANTSLLPSALFETFRGALLRLSDSLIMTTGRSMEVMWKTMHPAVPSSAEAWSVFNDLSSLIERFDSLAKHTHKLGNVESIVEIKHTFLLVMADMLSSDTLPSAVMASAQPLRDILAQLEQIEAAQSGAIDKSLHQITSWLLASKQLRLISSSQSGLSSSFEGLPNLREILHLAHHANTPTLRLLPYALLSSKAIQPHQRAVFVSLLHDLLEGLNPADDGEDATRGPASFLSGDVTKAVFKALKEVRKSETGQVDQRAQEFKDFSQHLSRHAADMTADKVDQFLSVLVGEFLDLITIHRQHYDAVQVSSIEEFLDVVRSSLDSHANAVDLDVLCAQAISDLRSFCTDIQLPAATDYLSDALTEIAKTVQWATESVSERLVSCGKAWASFAAGCLYLYVPNVPFDPAIAPRIKYERWLKQRDGLSSYLSALLFFGDRFTGNVAEPRLIDLQNKLQAKSAPPQGSVSNIVRPPKSQMGTLHRELSQFMSSVLDNGHLRQLINDLDSESNNAVSQEKLFQQTWTRFSQRLRSAYPMYKDMLEPLLGFIANLKFGLSTLAEGVLIRQVADASERTELLAQLVSIPALAGELPDVEKVSRVLHCATDIGAPKYFVEKLMVFVVSQLEFHSRLKGNLTASDAELMEFIFRRFYQQWSLERKKQLEENEADASLYRHKNTERTEEELEEEYKLMFPDYEDVGMTTTLSSRSGKSDRDMRSNMHSDLMDIHAKLMLDVRQRSLGASVASLATLLEQGQQLASDLSEADVLPVSDASVSMALPSQVLAAQSSLAWLNGVSRDESSEAFYDFYKDPNLRETKRVIPLLDALIIRVKAILDVFPEHVTLQDIRGLAEQIHSLPLISPLAQILTKLEQLYGVVDQWQKVASREFSLQAHCDGIRDLIISWRRFELSKWPQLFHLQDEHFRRDVGQWWFQIYETAVANILDLDVQGDDVSSHILELVGVLSTFLSGANVGQYKARLQLIRNFAQYAATIAKFDPIMGKIGLALENIAEYFSLFSSQIDKSFEEKKKALEQKITETVKLASWKDVNVYALKASAKRSHVKLYNTIRKYRAILEQPAAAILQQGLVADPEMTKESGNDVLTPRDVQVNVQQEAIQRSVSLLQESNHIDFSRRPERLVNVELTVRNMSGIISRSDRNGLSIGSSRHLEDFTLSLLQDIEEYRKLTPSVLKEETENEVKHLKTRKRKAFTDAMKELRRIGLKSRMAPEVFKKQANVNDLLARTPGISETCGTHAGRAVLKGVNTYFYRILEFLPRIRGCLFNHSEDIQKSEVQRGQSFVESLLTLILEERSLLSGWQRDLEGLQVILSEYRSLAANGAVEWSLETLPDLTCTVTPAMVSEVLIILRRACSVLATSLEVIAAQSELASLPELQSVSEALRAELQSSSSIIRDLEESSEHEKHVLSTSTSAAVFRARSWSNALCQRLATLAVDHSNLAYMLEPVHGWLVKSFTVSFQRDDSSPRRFDIAALDSGLQKTCDSILVAMQRLRKGISELTSIDGESLPDNAVQTIHKSNVACVKALHIASLIKPLSLNLETLASSLSVNTEEDSLLVRALFAMAWPIIEQYGSICEEVFLQFSEYHRSVQKSMYVLSSSFFTLASKGFCTPQAPEQSQAGNSKGMSEGTGLGEGEGANDISNDIKDDEDLTDLAQEPDKEGDKGDHDAEKDAIEMDQDFEGALEDLSGREEEDEGEDSGDEENEELDENVGDVDDLDPSAVDEKQWEEEAGDDLKDSGKDVDQQQGGEAQQQETNTVANEDKKKGESGRKEKQESEGEPQEQDAQDQEMEEDGEEDVGEDDNLEHQDGEGLQDQHIPEAEILDLPEDLNLNGEEEKEAEGEDEDEFDMDGLDDMPKEDVKDEPSESREQEDEEMAGPEEEKLMEGKVSEEDMDVDEKTEEEQEVAEEEGRENGQEEEAQSNEEEQEGQDGQDEGMDEQDQPVSQEDKQNPPKSDQKNLPAQEGLQGPEEDAGDDGEDAGAAQREDGQKGAGQSGSAQDEHQMQDQEGERGDQQEIAQGANGGADRGTDAPQDASKAMEEAESSGEQDPFRSLGDAMNEWKRQVRDILDSTQREEEQSDAPAIADAEDFEYIDDDEKKHDTQALGNATEEQAETLRDEMAAEDQEEQVARAPAERRPEMPEPADEDEMMADAPEQGEPQEDTEAKQSGALIGTRPDVQRDHDELRQGTSLEDGRYDVDSDIDEIEQEILDLDLDAMGDVEPTRTLEEARELWQRHEQSTQDLAIGLCEQLRLILEPTLATKMRGDFRTGKRLNMKRIIPYIASQYKKDKIWMRRTKPSKRQYQVMIAIDDSKSMAESESVNLAFETMALVAKALTQLEVGQISIVSFGEQTRLVHPFSQPFTSEAGTKVFQHFSFDQQRTNVRALTETSVSLFESARALQDIRAGGDELWQLEIIISDGVCEDHEALKRLVRRAREEKIMMIFVIIDALHGSRKDSILDMNQVKYETVNGQMKLNMSRYLDTFPFDYFVIVRDVKELPGVLSSALRQWFAALTQSS